MDHLQALNAKASERYLLEEMSEPERFAFEDHYFGCQECAEEVRIGAALARGIHAVGKQDRDARPKAAKPRTEGSIGRWWGWLTPAALIPSFAALMLAGIVGYQELVTIPGLSGPRAVTPIVLRAAARGDEQTVTRQSGQPYTPLQFDVNAVDPGTAMRYELAPEGAPIRIQGNAVAPPLGVVLQIDAPNAQLNRAGSWNLILRTSAGNEITRYPFLLTIP